MRGRWSAPPHRLSEPLPPHSLGLPRSLLRRVARGRKTGQALVETAITLPVIMVVLLVYLALLVRIEAQVELDTATSLAAASCAAAPAGSTVCRDWAQATFQGTLHQYGYITGAVLNGCQTAQVQFQCQASATIDYAQTPMGWAIAFPTPSLTSHAEAFGSPYRST
jgi:hypothetical protein